MSWETIAELAPAVTTNPLWAGSMAGMAYEHGILTRTMLAIKIKSYEQCGDLTAEEAKLLAALKETVAAFDAMWDF